MALDIFAYKIESFLTNLHIFTVNLDTMNSPLYSIHYRCQTKIKTKKDWI